MRNQRRFIPIEQVGQQPQSRQAPSITIRPAALADVDGIAALIQAQAQRGNLLPRRAATIYETIEDWIVAALPAGSGSGSEEEILGCVSLLHYPSGLVEVRSLAVQESAQGLGIGSRLLEALLAEAQGRGIPALFALTRAVPFFSRFGFAVTGKEHFPEKVWRDCWHCPLVDACDETAMVLRISSK